MGVSHDLKRISVGRILTYFKAFYRVLFDGAEINHKKQYPNGDSNPRPPEYEAEWYSLSRIVQYCATTRRGNSA
jgi:hypothetical protein